MVTGYDRSGLINESINTLKRDLILEAIIVSFVCIAFLFHFPFRAGAHSHPSDRGAGGVYSDVLPERQFQRDVAGRTGAGDWRADRRGHCDGGERIQTSLGTQRLNAGEHTGKLDDRERRRILVGAAKQVGPALVLFADHHSGVIPSGVPAGGAGRPHVPAAGLDQDAGLGFSHHCSPSRWCRC